MASRRKRKATDATAPLQRFRRPSFWLRPAWEERSRTDAALRALLAPLLDPYLTTNRVALTGNKNTLSILCRDRGSATDLRFLQRDIIKALQATGENRFSKVKVTIDEPEIEPAPEPAPVERRLSTTTCRLLLSTAETIRHPRLAAALSRLARQGNQNR